MFVCPFRGVGWQRWVPQFSHIFVAVKTRENTKLAGKKAYYRTVAGDPLCRHCYGGRSVDEGVCTHTHTCRRRPLCSYYALRGRLHREGECRGGVEAEYCEWRHNHTLLVVAVAAAAAEAEEGERL